MEKFPNPGNGYTIREKLGVGNWKTAYRATSMHSAGDVAILYFHDDSMQKAFTGEVLAQLRAGKKHKYSDYIAEFNAAAGRVPGNLARSRVRIKPGESRGGAPRGERARSRWFCVSGSSVARFRARGAGGWQHPLCVARTPYPCVCRRSASPHFLEAKDR
jgi:hypothetical protein